MAHPTTRPMPWSTSPPSAKGDMVIRRTPRMTGTGRRRDLGPSPAKIPCPWPGDAVVLQVTHGTTRSRTRRTCGRSRTSTHLIRQNIRDKDWTSCWVAHPTCSRAGRLNLPRLRFAGCDRPLDDDTRPIRAHQGSGVELRRTILTRRLARASEMWWARPTLLVRVDDEGVRHVRVARDELA